MPTLYDSIGLSSRIKKYSQGAAQAAMDRLDIANFVAPVVTVGGILYEWWKYDSRNGYRIAKTRRAEHGTANILTTGGTRVTGKLNPNGLDVTIDEAEQLLGDQLFVTLRERADEAIQAAALSHENEVITTALANAGSTQNVNAAQASTVDLKSIFDTAILSLIKSGKMGSDVNVKILFGANAGVKFTNHQSIRGLFKGGRRDTATPPLNDVSGLLLGNPQIKHNLTIIDSSTEGAAESSAFEMTDAVLLFLSSSTPSTRDPSYMKTFALNEGIMKAGTYQSVDGRQFFAKLDWYTAPTVTNAPAAIRINLNDS